MTPYEHRSAAKALMRWFESQQIHPADGVAIMSLVKAACLTDTTCNSDKLQFAADNIHNLLILDISRCLNHDRG